MNKVKIQVDIPEEILLNLRQSSEEFQKEMKLITAIELYKKDKLSLGKAAELCGFSKNAFIEIMNYRGETVFNYSNQEIEEELNNIDKISKMLGENNEGNM